MRVALFLCNNETMTECYTLGLFGTAGAYGRQVKQDDLCFLYNYSDNCVYGVWIATSDGGTYNAKAWDGNFRNQVKIKQISERIMSVKRTQVSSLNEESIGKIYLGDHAQELLQHFASVYHQHVIEGVSSRGNEEDYRNLYPANFFCDDGHKVRSAGEKIIDDWLRRHNVQHDYESITSVPGLIPDFTVYSRKGEPVFIEYWGMTGPEYEKRRLHKSQIYAKFFLPLIELYQRDLQIIDAVLTNKLSRLDVAYR
jgi:hypothetical protein